MKYSILIAALVMVGCSSAPKLAKTIKNGNAKGGAFSDTVASVTRQLYPCEVVLTDSAAYKQALTERDALLNTVGALMENNQRLDSSIEALRKDSLQYYSLTNCTKALQYLYSLTDSKTKSYDSLRKAFDKLKASKPPSIPIYFEDSAKNKLYQSAIDKWKDSANYYKAKWQVDHEWREAKEKQESGKLVIRIPWLWIILVVLGGGAVTYLKLKTKIL